MCILDAKKRSRSSEIISKSEPFIRNTSCDTKNEEFRQRLLKEFNDELIRSDYDFTNKTATSSITLKRLVNMFLKFSQFR